VTTTLGRSQFFTVAIATVLACISGWGYLHGIDLLAYLGALGGMAMFMVNGAHGGNIFGGLVFIIVNAVVYYYLTKIALHVWRKIRTTRVP